MSFTLPENTAFLVAVENEFLLFSPEQRSSLARNSPLEEDHTAPARQRPSYS